MTAPPSLIPPDILAEMCEMAGRTPEGCFVEVGVYKGGSAWHLLQVAKAQDRNLYCFDTFTGMPNIVPELDSHAMGDFGDTDYETVCAALPGATVVKCVFPVESGLTQPVAFAHIDCDQYLSVRDAIAYLDPLMVQGGVMWFDDVPLLKGATLAVAEAYGYRIRYTNSPRGYVRF